MTRSGSPETTAVQHLFGIERHIETVKHLAVSRGAVIYLYLHFMIYLLVNSQCRTRILYIAEDKGAVVRASCRIPLRTTFIAVVNIPDRDATHLVTIDRRSYGIATAVETVRIGGLCSIPESSVCEERLRPVVVNQRPFIVRASRGSGTEVHGCPTLRHARQQVEMSVVVEGEFIDMVRGIDLLHRTWIDTNRRKVVRNDFELQVIERNGDDTVVVTGDVVPLMVCIVTDERIAECVGAISSCLVSVGNNFKLPSLF